jgi:hypothetical protein
MIRPFEGARDATKQEQEAAIANPIFVIDGKSYARIFAPKLFARILAASELNLPVTSTHLPSM